MKGAVCEWRGWLSTSLHSHINAVIAYVNCADKGKSVNEQRCRGYVQYIGLAQGFVSIDFRVGIKMAKANTTRKTGRAQKAM